MYHECNKKTNIRVIFFFKTDLQALRKFAVLYVKFFIYPLPSSLKRSSTNEIKIYQHNDVNYHRKIQ